MANPLQIRDPNEVTNPLEFGGPGWADAWSYVTAPVSALSAWLAEQRAKNAERKPVEPIWPIDNPVGTQRYGDPEMRNAQPGFRPAATVGGGMWGEQRPVSQEQVDAFGEGSRWLYDQASLIGGAPGGPGRAMVSASARARPPGAPPLPPRPDNALAPGFRMYHGSPHSFDRFSTKHIGTGEGAQAYGHGLYFAEREGVAKGYRDELSSRTDHSTSTGGTIPNWIGNSIARVQDDPNLVRGVVNGHLQDFKGRLAEAQAEIQTSHQPWLAEDRVRGLQKVIGDLEAIHSGKASLLPRGSMYEVNIKADPEHFLQWDKPLSQQSPAAQDAMLRVRFGGNAEQIAAAKASDDYMGRSVQAFLNDLAHPKLAGSQAAASAALRDAGIPGIRYLDQGSRGAEQGTHNAVVFDEATIEILRKYGIAGLLAGGGAAVATQRPEQ